jgi:integrase
MTSIRLRFVKAYRDRHGKPRYYLRRPGSKLVPLPGHPGSPEFMAAYTAALDRSESSISRKLENGARRTRPESIDAAIASYLGSAAYARLAAISQRQYRAILERMRPDLGAMPIAGLRRRHVVELLDARAAAHPASARDLLRCLRIIIRHALFLGMCETDPTAGVRVKMPHSDGFHSWTEEEIAAFQNYYPLGSRPRLAIELLLGTAMRCSDVVRLGRGHVHNGTIVVPKTQKTKQPLAIPISAALAEALNTSAPAESMVYLLNDLDRPFTAAGFGMWFVKHCVRAGLSGCTAHGLRKAASRRLAEAGCTAPEIAAITGHKSLREVQRYIDAADRKKLARNAMAKLFVVGRK